MREFDRLGKQIEAEEITAKRTPNSKTFDLGNGQKRLVSSMALIHYEKDGKLEDIDLTLEDGGDHYFMNKAPYSVRIEKSSPKITYTRGSDVVEMTLESADAQPIQHSHRTKDRGVIFDGIMHNEIHVNLTAAGVSTEQHIASAAGIKTLKWKIRQTMSEPVVTETRKRGADKNGAPVEINITRPRLAQKGGMWEHTFEERFTGNKMKRDRKTRKYTMDGLAEYPVKVKS